MKILDVLILPILYGYLGNSIVMWYPLSLACLVFSTGCWCFLFCLYLFLSVVMYINLGYIRQWSGPLYWGIWGCNRRVFRALYALILCLFRDLAFSSSENLSSILNLSRISGFRNGFSRAQSRLLDLFESLLLGLIGSGDFEAINGHGLNLWFGSKADWTLGLFLRFWVWLCLNLGIIRDFIFFFFLLPSW